MRNKTVILFTGITILFSAAFFPPTSYPLSGTWRHSVGRTLSYEIVGDQTIEFGNGPWHQRLMAVFVTPRDFTIDNVEGIFRLLSQDSPGDDYFEIYASSDLVESQCVAEGINDLRYSRPHKPACRITLDNAPRPYAYYNRSDMFEYYYYYPSQDGAIRRDLYAPDDPCSSSTDRAVDLVVSSGLCPEHVKQLLDSGLDPNVKSRYGGSALVNASYWGNEEAVVLLLERGANINQTSSAGWTALSDRNIPSTSAYRRPFVRTWS